MARWRPYLEPRKISNTLSEWVVHSNATIRNWYMGAMKCPTDDMVVPRMNAQSPSRIFVYSRFIHGTTMSSVGQSVKLGTLATDDEILVLVS